MNKYTFVTVGTVQSKIGVPVVKYGNTWKQASGHLIADINVVRKSQGLTALTIDPDDYQTLSSFITALNELTTNDIVKVYEETVIYPI